MYCGMTFPTIKSIRRGWFWGMWDMAQLVWSWYGQVLYLKGFWTWWSHDQSFPNWAEKSEILTKPQQFEKWHLPIWMVQLVPRPIFNGDNESGHKIDLFNLEHLLCPKQWWEYQGRLGNILQMGWFDLYMDLVFKENPDLKREIWNSYQITLYSCFNGSGWNWE